MNIRLIGRVLLISIVVYKQQASRQGLQRFARTRSRCNIMHALSFRGLEDRSQFPCTNDCLSLNRLLNLVSVSPPMAAVVA